MKKEEKDKIMYNSVELLRESAKSLEVSISTDFEDFTEKDLLERLLVALNTHFSTTQAMMFNMMRLLAENTDDK